MTDLADREWRLVREEARAGAMHMALDEVAAETAAAGGPRTIRLYRWEPSTLSLGYHQDPATVDWGYCEHEGIEVTRRPTGGGAIYHDNHGDVSYSIVAPAAELPGDLMDCYELLLEPVMAGLSAVGMDVQFASEERPAVHQPACYLRELHPAHDVVAGDGRKLAGNAQYRRRDSVIQHGSITFESTPERHLAVFADHDLEPADFDGRVTAVAEQTGCTRTVLVEALTDELARWADAEDGSWSDDELARARTLAEEKYGAEAWVRAGTDPT